MEHLLEFFDFFKKSEKTWKDKLISIKKSFDIYKNDYSKKIYLESNIQSNYFSLSILDGRINENLIFTKRSDDYEVLIEYKDVVKITESDYKYAKDIAQEISDFLDEKSEKEFNISNTTINSDGSINFNELDIALDQLGYDLEDKIFNKYLNKSFEFEIKYYLWSEETKTEEIVERKNLKINDIKIGYTGDRFYINLHTKGVMNENCSIWIESDTKKEYTDLEKRFSRGIKMDIVKEPMSRKSQREYVRKYPNIISYDVSPSKYDTIEFISDIVELLAILNKELKINK